MLWLLLGVSYVTTHVKILVSVVSCKPYGRLAGIQMYLYLYHLLLPIL